MKQSRPKLKAAGVREISRATGYSVCYVSIVRHNMRKARPLRAKMVELGVTPEKARTVLPNSLKTELIMTANCAEWIHFFELRACNSTGKAHPQILEVSRPLLDEFKVTIAEVFDDLKYE